VQPLVSISVTTYQHEAYLAACLDGILMQQCDFEYEVLLGEDESSDGTRAIAERYAKAHPERIRLFLHRRDQVMRIDGRPTGRFNLLNNLRHAKGRYLCHIDGDDRWTDPQRLRIMVEKMEAEPELGLAFHNAMNVWDDGRTEPFFKPGAAKPRYSVEDLTRSNFIPTAGVIWRWNQLREFPEAFSTAPFGDWALNIHFALQGPIGFVDRMMAERHVHAGGIMSGMKGQRERRATALAYEVMHGQVGDRLAHQAKERWLAQIEQGMENAQRSGDRELMRWFLMHSARLPAGCLPWRKRARWWVQLHWPRLMRAYGRLRKVH